MESFLKEYNYLKTVEGINDISKYELYKQLLIDNKRKSEKLVEICDTDQESLIQSLNGGLPIPGLMYTFLYSLDKSEKTKGLNDRAPIVHCYKVEKGMMYGINLNLFPPLVRLAYLQGFYDMYLPFFKNIEQTSENNILTINKHFMSDVVGKKIKPFIDKVSVISKQNISYGYRAYKYNNIINFRMVEFNEWKLIPFFDAKNSFIDRNLGRIYTLYNNSKFKAK